MREGGSWCVQAKGLYILKLKTQTTTPDHFRVARGCKKLVECRVVLHAGTVQNALHTHIHCVVVLFTSH